ncbi:hypothetical protein [Nonomuraea sp. NPDC003214]
MLWQAMGVPSREMTVFMPYDERRARPPTPRRESRSGEGRFLKGPDLDAAAAGDGVTVSSSNPIIST